MGTTSRIVVLTSVYGDTLLVDPPAQTVDATWIAISDRRLSSDIWQVRYEPRPHLHPRLAEQLVKYAPADYAPPDTDILIWVDGGVRINSADTIAVLSDSLVRWSPRPADVAMIPHPDRTRLTDEAVAAAAMKQYKGQRIIEQAEHYLHVCGMPDDYGLWATTVIVYRNTWYAVEFGDMIIRECLRWSLHDPLAVPYVSWKIGLPVAAIDFDSGLSGT